MWFSSQRDSGESPQGPISPDPQRLEFGTVWEQRNFTWAVPLRNASSGTVSISHIAGDCDCTAIEPRELEIGPGETRAVELTLDLTRGVWEEGESSRPFSVTLFPRFGGRNDNPATWTVRGRVRRNPLSVSTRVVDFGDHLIAGTAFSSRSLIVTVPATGELRDVRAICVPESAGRVDLQPLFGRPGHYRLEVIPAESLDKGRFQFAVHIMARHASISPGPAAEVTVVGTIRGDIEAQPSKLLFGARPLGDSAVDHLVFFSHSGRPVSVRLLESDSGLRVAPLPEADPLVPTFEVRQRFSQRGEHRASIEFEARYLDSDDPPEAIVVETSYYGIADPFASVTEPRP